MERGSRIKKEEEKGRLAPEGRKGCCPVARPHRPSGEHWWHAACVSCFVMQGCWRQRGGWAAVAGACLLVVSHPIPPKSYAAQTHRRRILEGRHCRTHHPHLQDLLQGMYFLRKGGEGPWVCLSGVENKSVLALARLPTRGGRVGKGGREIKG